MGIILYKEPIDKRLEDEAFYNFFMERFDEEHKGYPTVLDDDTLALAMRNIEYVDRIYIAYTQQSNK